MEKMGGKTSVPMQKQTWDYNGSCLTRPAMDRWERFFKVHSKLGENAYIV